MHMLLYVSSQWWLEVYKKLFWPNLRSEVSLPSCFVNKATVESVFPCNDGTTAFVHCCGDLHVFEVILNPFVMILHLCCLFLHHLVDFLHHFYFEATHSNLFSSLCCYLVDFQTLKLIINSSRGSLQGQGSDRSVKQSINNRITAHMPVKRSHVKLWCCWKQNEWSPSGIYQVVNMKLLCYDGADRVKRRTVRLQWSVAFGAAMPVRKTGDRTWLHISKKCKLIGWKYIYIYICQ